MVVCSICFKEIEIQESGWDKGHNAEPINNGRCCQNCNYSIVVLARYQQFKNSKKQPKINEV